MATVVQLAKNFNGQGQEKIARPLCFDLAWPILHCLHLNDISFQECESPILDQKKCSAFVGFCGMKGYKSSFANVFSQGQLMTFMGREESAKIARRISLKAARSKVSTFP